MSSGKIQLDRKEKTILVDVLRWYDEEYETEEEEVAAAIETLEDSRELNPDLVDINFIKETVIEDFSIELQPYLRDMENSQTAVNFFKEGFKNISKKIQQHTYQDSY